LFLAVQRGRIVLPYDPRQYLIVKDVPDELGRGNLWAVVVLEWMLQGRKRPTLVMKTPLDYFVQYQGWPHSFVDALVDLQDRVRESPFPNAAKLKKERVRKD
jgi:hypothetical protein